MEGKCGEQGFYFEYLVRYSVARVSGMVLVSGTYPRRVTTDIMKYSCFIAYDTQKKREKQGERRANEGNQQR